jgi:hypothetical protein
VYVYIRGTLAFRKVIHLSGSAQSFRDRSIMISAYKSCTNMRTIDKDCFRTHTPLIAQAFTPILDAEKLCGSVLPLHPPRTTDKPPRWDDVPCSLTPNSEPAAFVIRPRVRTAHRRAPSNDRNVTHMCVKQCKHPPG